MTASWLAPPVDFGFSPDRFPTWRVDQPDAIQAALEAPTKFVGLVLPTGCVAWDTEIRLHRAGVGYRDTIAREYVNQFDPRRKTSITTRIRAHVGTHVGLHPIAGVTYSGVRETFRLVLDGDSRTVRATPDHEILTLNGFMPLAELTGTDRVVCEHAVTAKQPRETGRTRAPKRNYRVVQGLIFHPYAGTAGSWRQRQPTYAAEGRLYRVAYHRLVVEAALNEISVEALILRCRTSAEAVSGLTFLDPKVYAVHHLDGKHQHNTLDNLVVLPHGEHNREHGIVDRTHGYFGDNDVEEHGVLRIEPYGPEDTYDVQCADPHRNFVANGIVVHNSGKSLTAMTIARLTGWRTVYLTSTKALQDQLERDFTPLVTLLKGQAAYPCDALAPGGEYADWNPDGERRGCQEGPCHVGKRCPRKGDEHETATCQYFRAVSRSMRARLLVTNYAAWLAHRIHAVGLGAVDCLILDEAHAAPDELAGALRVEIQQGDLKAIGGEPWPKGDLNTADGWQSVKGWAGNLAYRLSRELDSRSPDTKGEAQYHRRAQRLADALGKIVASDPDITLVREEYGRLTVEPVWAATYVDYLWKGIPKVIAMSATVRPKTLELLGVGTPQTTWYESDGDFPVARRPVYHVRTTSVRHTWTAEQEQWWLSRIDDILRARPDVKGIIHTVSYARRNRILQKSAFRSRLISHDRDDTAKQVEAFKRSSEPLVLVSPSVTTGYDFPDACCRFQIIGKVPFPDSRDPITERRTILDPDYPAYLAMQELVQACGRSVRSKTDWAENFVIDDNLSWFVRKYKHFAPRHFLRAVQTVDVIPRRPTW